jgi:hypothetical protein
VCVCCIFFLIAKKRERESNKRDIKYIRERERRINVRKTHTRTLEFMSKA